MSIRTTSSVVLLLAGVGVVARDVLDEECPNVTLYRGINRDRRYLVNYIA